METDYLLDIINSVKDAETSLVITVKGNKYSVYIDGCLDDISHVIQEEDSLKDLKHAYCRNLRTNRAD